MTANGVEAYCTEVSEAERPSAGAQSANRYHPFRAWIFAFHTLSPARATTTPNLPNSVFFSFSLFQVRTTHDTLHPQHGIDYKIPTALCTSLVNVAAIAMKDKAFARMCSKEPAAFPLASYGALAFADRRIATGCQLAMLPPTNIYPPTPPPHTHTHTHTPQQASSPCATA